MDGVIKQSEPLPCPEVFMDRFDIQPSIRVDPDLDLYRINSISELSQVILEKTRADAARPA
ncbi:hypothetical protein A1348_08795 [Pseudomonas protegens]|nr:hypothetical protein A1348_08795 [Pseudomonas protegens]